MFMCGSVCAVGVYLLFTASGDLVNTINRFEGGIHPIRCEDLLYMEIDSQLQLH